MRALFMPCVGEPIPHLIPLLALASRLDADRHETAFLAPRRFHAALQAMGHTALDIDYENGRAFQSEMQAYEQFRPDVVVDDLGLTALLSTTLSQTPRVTVRRTGVFPGAEPRSRAHLHSCIGNYPSYFDYYKTSALYRVCDRLHGVPPPASLVDLCAAHMNVVAGIAAIETLPDAVANDPTYVFAGPLMIADSACARIMGANQRGEVDGGALADFFSAHRHRRVICVTLGTVLDANAAFCEVVRHVLARGHAIVSSVEPPAIEASWRERYFYARVLPMDYVCSRAHLMIHHCGSGTYQYQMRHALPAICIGSGYYDRDDVAVRLQELGVSRYVPPVDEAPERLDILRRVFDECADDAGPWYRRATERLRMLRAEGERTAARFDFEDVLERARAARPN